MSLLVRIKDKEQNSRRDTNIPGPSYDNWTGPGTFKKLCETKPKQLGQEIADGSVRC